jgi:hypothetical protein
MFRGRRQEAIALIDELQSLGHHVSFHLTLSPHVESVTQRLESLSREIPQVSVDCLTFHAPGIPPEVLAAAPFGSTVYESMSTQSGQYFSDSTGSWRWGDPREGFSLTSPVQLLIHPFWLTDRHQQLVEEIQRSRDVADFMPQLTSLVRATGP